MCNERRPCHRVIALAACCALAAVSPRCASDPKDEPVWTPRPTTEWKRIAVAPVPQLQDDSRILIPEPTVGLFPANMAVTRVAVEEVHDDADLEPLLFADPRNEFLQWNRAFDDQMALSEVFPIQQRDLGGGKADPEQILAAFRALHARLGLIYAVNELGPDETEMIGALYDTAEPRPLAAFHARARSVTPPPDEEKESKDPPDLWETDSRALVRAKFEKQVYAALRTLITHDRPSRTDPPAGWIPAGPIQPVEWPPRRRVPPS